MPAYSSSLFEVMGDICLESNISPTPPDEIMSAYLDMKSRDQHGWVVQFCLKYWFLLREPSISEIETYHSAYAYVSPSGNRDITISVRRSAVIWLLERCIIFPTDISIEEIAYYPKLIESLTSILLSNVNITQEELEDRIKFHIEEPVIKTRYIERVYASSGIAMPENFPSMCPSTVYKRSACWENQSRFNESPKKVIAVQENPAPKMARNPDRKLTPEQERLLGEVERKAASTNWSR